MKHLIEFIGVNLPDEYRDSFAMFAERLQASSEQPLDEHIKLLLEAYCEHCGISYGYRSVYWDLSMTLLQYKYPDEDFSDLFGHIPDYIPEWNKYKDYDAGMNLEPTIILAVKMALTGCVNDNNLPSFCVAMNKFMEQLEPSDIDENVLQDAISSCFSEEEDLDAPE